MKFLFFIWIPLANAVANPTSNELISKSLGQSPGFSYLNGSNEACPGHCKSGWTYFDETDACYKGALLNQLPRLLGITYEQSTAKKRKVYMWFKRFRLTYCTFFDANAYDAEYICNTFGGHLTSIHSSAENIFVNELARTNKQWKDNHELTWIGLWAEGTGSKKWTWTDGTKVDYLAWVVGAPDAPLDERCVHLYSDRRLDQPFYRVYYQKWNDYYCAEKLRAFVCKKTALH